MIELDARLPEHQIGQQPATLYTGAWNNALDELDPDAYPNLHALREPPHHRPSPEQFEYGLNHVIESFRPLDKPVLTAPSAV